MKEKVRAYLSVAASKIGISTDYWRSPNRIPFLVVTGRWVNPDGIAMKSTVLDFCKVDTEHTGVETKNVLLKVIEDFDIRKKVSGADIFGDNSLRQRILIPGLLCHRR